MAVATITSVEVIPLNRDHALPPGCPPRSPSGTALALAARGTRTIINAVFRPASLGEIGYATAPLGAPRRE